MELFESSLAVQIQEASTTNGATQSQGLLTPMGQNRSHQGVKFYLSLEMKQATNTALKEKA